MKQKNVCTNTHRDSVNVDVLDKYTVTFQQTRLTEVWLRSRPCVRVCKRDSHRFPEGTELSTLGLPYFSISAPTPWILCPFLHWEFICCGSYLRSLALLTALPTGPGNLASFQIWYRDMTNSFGDGNIPKSHLREGGGGGGGGGSLYWSIH